MINLTHSLSLLEDLALTGHDTSPINGEGSGTLPSTSPALTGALELLIQGMTNTVRRLLDLPSGLRF